MCGVHLVYNRKSSQNPRLIHSKLDEMASTAQYRGPDSTSTHYSDHYALGFNRLSIVGGKQGNQPIFSKDKSITLICNGEIYNHAELKRQYFSSIRFSTTSDVEIIIHLYEKFGVDVFTKLDGQFSCILVDERNRKIILARDRFGIHPLYYSILPDYFVASSSIKSILKARIIEKPALNAKALAEHWFFYGAHAPNTVYKNISQVPPCSYLEFDVQTEGMKTRKYEPRKTEENDLYEMLKNSVSKRLQGDSTPGIYVSGGLDSSIIAYLANQVSKTKPELFGISFEDKKYDESYYQKKLARGIGFILNTLHIQTKDIFENIDECIYYCESPLIRSAPVPLMLLSKLVHEKGIKFVICGEGADELFMGYPVFRNKLSSIFDKQNELITYIKFFDKDIHKHIADIYQQAKLDQKDEDYYRQEEIDTKLSRYLLANQGDRMSMSHSVEQRFPFLDDAVANFARAKSHSDLIDQKETKKILREAFKGKLSNELVSREKQGYLTPDSDVGNMIIMNSELGNINCADLFDSEVTRNFIAGLQTKNKSISQNDYRLLLFIYSTINLHRILMGEIV